MDDSVSLAYITEIWLDAEGSRSLRNGAHFSGMTSAETLG